MALDRWPTTQYGTNVLSINAVHMNEDHNKYQEVDKMTHFLKPHCVW